MITPTQVQGRAPATTADEEVRLPYAELREARRRAAGVYGRATEILEERLGLPPALFVERLALTLGFRPINAIALAG